ncbi:MAG: hypothetical protein IPJ87_03405 [Flavobacteriales bacterium]|jgi:hypothetical protein|nr:hypothetical protein [Flavobacteriales bacterium]MBK7940913.1 hypothetical protein [Flavobacteriales bacterium]MBK9701664.1 hypothetical protein [Flavobacteriales bacterium]
MRAALCCLLLLPIALCAQDAQRFQRALRTGNVHALDRWMKQEVHRMLKGQVHGAPQAVYMGHDNSYDTLVAFLRRQPGVQDAAWDKYLAKAAIWPGHSTIGMRWQKDDRIHERCWSVQEGVPRTINIFGWRPRVREDRQNLRYENARDCPGFVEQQRKYPEHGRHQAPAYP